MTNQYGPAFIVSAFLLALLAARSANPSAAAEVPRETTATERAKIVSEDQATVRLAQSSTRGAFINTAKVVAAEPASETPIAIQVGPPEAVPKGSFIRIKGTPGTFDLTEGFAIAPGLWAVPLNGLSNLRIKLPAGATGESQVAISIATVDGKTLAETTVNVVAHAGSKAAGAAPVQPADSSGAPSSLPKAIPKQSVGIQRAQSFITRGQELLADGNISGARLLYERAADAGLAQGAVALAATFDPAELARLNVRGLTPDPAAAKKWYERARALGADEVDDRLKRLSAK